MLNHSKATGISEPTGLIDGRVGALYDELRVGQRGVDPCCDRHDVARLGE